MEEEFIYPGYFSDEAKKFFGTNCESEERDGCSVVGRFIKLSSGETRLASKGDKFIRKEDGTLQLNK